jgi:predicted nucleic acid-binding protein
MRFWDASAIVPLIAEEATSASLFERLEADADILVWWGTPVEIISALSRLEREATLSANEVDIAQKNLRLLVAGWSEIVPSDAVRHTAARLLRTHPLRAADSLQLAAALIAADYDARALEMVCLDERLAAAARREGFAVIGASA